MTTKTITKSQLKQMIKETLSEQQKQSDIVFSQEQSIDEVLFDIKHSLEKMREVDPKGFRLWMKKLSNLDFDLRQDVEQAARWSVKD